MCGIVGIFGPGAAHREHLYSMLRSVRTRGETDETHFGPSFCMGTRRLKIVDRERAIQPIFNEDQTKCIIFNGEIFNFRELKARLEGRHRFATDSDTETILHSYEEWGPECVRKLDGQFAFVIYDLKENSVFAARDSIGVVPLYYVLVDGNLYVASIIKALTFLGRQINALPPGHTLDLNGSLSSYYQPVYGGSEGNRDDFVGKLELALQAAIAKRVDTDLPLGVIYSGGIDSSVVLHEALKSHGDVTAFTIGTPGSEDFEISQRYCQERGVRQILIPLRHRDIGPQAVERAIEACELNEYLDIINAVVSMPLFERIHTAGIKVVVGGDGSDELFGGYHMYQRIPTQDEGRLFLHNLMSLHRTELQRVDRCSMAFEVEVRVPFLDTNVVDLALRMPMAWKVTDGIEKWAVRQAFAADLPSYITTRSKNPLSYSSGLHEWVRLYKPLFRRYYDRHDYCLHAPIKMDFSYILEKNGYDLDAALAKEAKGHDHSRAELLKESFKAGIRRYLLER